MATQPAEPSPVPWDTAAGNRFAHYSTEDHSAPLWIAAFLSLTYVWAVLFIRIFLKWRIFGWDDFLVVISTVSDMFVQTHMVLTDQRFSSQYRPY